LVAGSALMLAPDSKTLRSWERISWNNCSLVSEGSLDRVGLQALVEWIVGR